MRDLKKGTEPNVLRILSDNIDIKPHATHRNGLLNEGLIVTINRYNLEDVLLQMLEDYGETELIERIRKLQ
jgi:hypothetical protein